MTNEESEDMRTAIAEAAQAAGLSAGELRLVRPPRHERVLREIAERFTTRSRDAMDHIFLWDVLRQPTASCHIPGPAYRFLPQLLPGDERAWFLAEDWMRTKRHGNYWLYDAASARLPDLLGELFRFEYYVVSKKFDWLVAENHHDVFIASGERAIARLTGFSPAQ
jgi:hypothetical protein